MPYFHLVYTVSHALNGLAAQAPRRVYEALFDAVSATLLGFAADPRHLGGVPAFTLALHTWTQQLERHPHVHALVAGGALTGAGDLVSPRRGFLFPVKALSRVFRGKLVAALTAQRTNGAFGSHPVSGAAGWRALLAALCRHDWVVYAKQQLGGPAQVLDYLARYTHKTAISNDHLRGLHDGQVSFRVRDPARPKAGRLASLPAAVFIERFLSHVLPTGFKRIRHYGLLASCRALLHQPTPLPAVIESVADFMRRVAGVEISRCTGCDHGRIQVIAALPAVRTSRAIRQATGPPA